MAEKILNPNCSEVVCKLPATTMDEAKKTLEGIGIKVVNVEWYVDFSDDTQMNYIVDPNNPNSPDFMHRAHLYIAEDFEAQGIFIIGHQHCQAQLFSTMRAIEKGLHIKFDGYDGGDIKEYADWKRKGEEMMPDWQAQQRKWIRLLLKRASFKTEIDTLFGKVDYMAPRYKLKNVKLSKFTEAAMANGTKEYKERMLEIKEKGLAEGGDGKQYYEHMKISPSTKRKRYIALETIVTKELLQHMDEMATEEQKWIRESWFGQMTKEKADEELTEERKAELFKYAASGITRTLYILIENPYVKKVYLDEKRQ
jgi:hypothetical protein